MDYTTQRRQDSENNTHFQRKVNYWLRTPYISRDGSTSFDK